MAIEYTLYFHTDCSPTQLHEIVAGMEEEILRLLRDAYLEDSELHREHLAQSHELLSIIDNEYARVALRRRVAANQEAIDSSSEKIKGLWRRLKECEDNFSDDGAKS